MIYIVKGLLIITISFFAFLIYSVCVGVSRMPDSNVCKKVCYPYYPRNFDIEDKIEDGKCLCDMRYVLKDIPK